MKKFEMTFKIDYSKLFGTWYLYFAGHLSGYIYYNNLFVFLDKLYKEKKVYPKKKDIFKPFRSLDFNDIRVVIIGDSPNSNKANGLAFSNEDSIEESSFSPQLLEIRKWIEINLYDGLKLDFDPTLQDWADQGVLLLNSALTAERGFPMSHYKHWNRFMTDTIKILNEFKPGIIFCLVGDEAKKFEPLIDSNSNYVLTHKFPYKEINNLIKKTNGKEYCIKW